MIDLSEIPLEDLEAELNKRKQEIREAKIKARAEKVCCQNCAYQFFGKTNLGNLQSGDSLVCYKRPKRIPRNYFETIPDYMQTYCACSAQYNGCTMFVHKESEEGRKIAKRLSFMSRVY